MQKTDDAAPATKGDLESLWIRIDKRFTRMDQQFDQVDQKFEQVDKRFAEMNDQFDDAKLHFGIVAEAMLQDFNGAFGDRQSQNTDEIKGVKARVSAIERRLRFSGR
jgi:phage-related minor tail protein